jgi:acyl carrier protein
MAKEQHLQERISALLGRVLELPGDSIAGDAHLMNDLGGDSWQYLEFRTELERVFNIIIPDGDVDRLATVDECSRLVREYLDRESPSKEQEEAAPAGAKKACDTYVGEDGAFYVDIEVGVRHMGRNNLAETPLMMLLGDMRRSHLNHFTGVSSKHLVDETNDRLYATFYYLKMQFPRENPLASFGENDRFTIVNTLNSYGNSVMDGYSFFYPASWPMEKKIPLKNGKQAEEMGIPYIRSSNIFLNRLEGANWQKKSRPAQPGVDNIPKIAELPDSYVLTKKASEEGSFGSPPEHFSSITPETLRVEYPIEPDRDLNEVGLLSFANYCMIQDISERRLFPEKPLIPIGHDLLDARTVVSRQSAYLANAQQSDSIFVSIDAWLENPFLADHPAPEMAPIRLFMNYEMVRRSDGRKMVVSQAEKVIFGKTLEDAGLLESLKKLAG